MRATTPEIDQRAKDLRATMTPAERAMWKLLRKHRQAGFYFRRQHPMARFIIDFCCTKAKLCIEVDGAVHAQQRERDEERTTWLEAMGYRVLRFANEEVLNAPHLVARRINQELTSGRARPERAQAEAGSTRPLRFCEGAGECNLSRYGRGGEPKRAGEGADPRCERQLARQSCSSGGPPPGGRTT